MSVKLKTEKMKKLFIYAMTALAALSTVSCKDDDADFGGANDLDRMPMTLFRRAGNTGTAESSDPYVSAADEDKLNSITLRWFGIEGCAGYEIKYAIGQGGLGDEWENPDRMEEFITVGPDVLEYTIDNLEYETTYCFAIRVLSPKGEAHHSKWYGYGTLSQWDDVCAISTYKRYPTPAIINVGEKWYDAFTIYMNLDHSASGDNESNNFTENFDVVDGKYVVDRIQVKASLSNPDAVVPQEWEDYVLTDEDKASGEIRVEGLSPNSVYVVNVINDSKIFTDPRTGKPVTVDAAYNTMTYRTKGDPGPVIKIPHYCDPNDTIKGAVEYNACRLDTIIINYTKDINLAEGQTFHLEGGKAYYFAGNTEICKGFTMETDPEDLAAGKRATVYLGGISKDGSNVRTNNFIFGRNKQSGEADAPIQVENVVFRGIDFAAPLAENYGVAAKNGTGNYFANMYSGGMAVTFDSFELYDCSFRDFVRGFVRLQGNKEKVFKKVVVDGCLFYNNGYYDNNGRGYAWFDVDKNHPKNNMFQDVTISKNTFYDSPREAFFKNGNGDVNFPADLHYDIKILNNTFINFSTRSTSRPLFMLQYVPGGSKFVVKKNLFVLAADDDDKRNLYNTTCDIRNINGSGEVFIEMEDNYSVGCRDAHMKDDGIFTSYPFSGTSRSFGTFYTGDKNDLKVLVGTTPLKATDLFTNPNPPHKVQAANDVDPEYHKAPENLLEALKYKQTATVTNHEIWTKNVGDPRWRN